MQFVDWQTLATFAGALAMVVLITQFTKDLGFVKKIPMAILYPAYYFTGRLNASNAVLILFNGMLTALAANGGFDAIKRAFPDLFK